MHSKGVYTLLGLWPVLLLAVLPSSCGREARPDPSDELQAAWADRIEQPDIVLILVDTLRRDRLGFYGHGRDTSPNLDRLASMSVVYENAFSQAPWTLPSVAAMLTSQYPSMLGIKGIREPIPDSTILLQEILSRHGYTTHAIVSHTFVGAEWGFARGFDSFQSFAGGHRVITSKKVTDVAMRLVDRLGEQPTFLLLHYFDPHYLYTEHERFRFAGARPDEEAKWWTLKFRQLEFQAQRGRISAAQRDYLYDLYDSEIAFTDFHIGRLLDRLEADGRLQNSIIIFTADHGEEFLEHSGIGHGTTLFNELINVPLVIKWPGVDEAVRSQRYVAHIDLLPTLLDYLDISLERELSGVHLRDRSSEKPIISENRQGADLTAVIGDGMKLVYDRRQDTIEFFDLDSDPAEAHPLERVGTGDELLAELWAFQERARVRDDQGPIGDEVAISEEQLRQLEALGYIE